MSLSLSSPDRPASLSQNVLGEIENFLHSVVRWDAFDHCVYNFIYIFKLPLTLLQLAFCNGTQSGLVFYLVQTQEGLMWSLVLCKTWGCYVLLCGVLFRVSSFPCHSCCTLVFLSFLFVDKNVHVTAFSHVYTWHLRLWFCFTCRYQGSIQPESLKIVLEFTLARGNLKSIFKVLTLLYGKSFIWDITDFVF